MKYIPLILILFFACKSPTEFEQIKQIEVTILNTGHTEEYTFFNYKIENTGNVLIKEYMIIFKIETETTDFQQNVYGEKLGIDKIVYDQCRIPPKQNIIDIRYEVIL